ncbi:hypothetical protein [Limosilactobacillus agrestimuris]|uniref:hypothetical protein n=1 Tax=Limosilactobacillus agrestimuris TaxID=2941331 RepID=UPI00203DEAAD|nr:hypothetical protein [Limosilactobacillus agrestimuris]
MENEILAKLGLFYKNNELVKCNNVDQLPTEIKKERPTYLDDFSIIIKRTFYFKQKDIASFNFDEETLFF